MTQKWFRKVTNQSALINSIPNVGLVVISIITLLVSLDISRTQISKNQENFDKQIRRDSLLAVQQDSITKQQTALTKFQLEVLTKSFENDSITNAKRISIALEEFNLNIKNKLESDIMNKENLSVKGISFLAYDTKYQEGNLDSVYGFDPDIIYPQENNKVRKDFQLLFRLVLYDIKTGSTIENMQMFQTIKDINEYISRKKINSQFTILKEFTVVCDLLNNTKFPITLLGNGQNALSFDGFEDSAFNAPQRGALNNLVIYPGEKGALSATIFLGLDLKLDNNFILNLRIDYQTIFGRKSKLLKAHLNSDDKSFVIFN